MAGKKQAKILLRDVPNSLGETDRDYLADHTNGFTGADLRLLLTESTLYQLNQLQTDDHEHDDHEHDDHHDDATVDVPRL